MRYGYRNKWLVAGMLQQMSNRIPEKYRFLSFLVITSMIGVALILFAVYNASKELEMIHEIDNLYRFGTAQLNSDSPDADNHQRLLALAAPGYQVLIVRGEQVLADSVTTTGSGSAIEPAALEQTRVNARGGYIELDGRMMTWTQLPFEDNDAQLIILHRFAPGGVDTLQQVYSKRLLVPAGFYIWLMVWMAFIIRFLTDKLSRQKQEMEYMALHDALSGLPNRNLLSDRLEKMVEASKRKQSHFSLAMIDLDGFKKINDTLGHEAGDAMLQEIARRLSTCLRSVDTVARVGGDEFVLLLDDLEQGSSLDICTRAAAEIAKPVLIQNAEVRVGSSIGIANFPEHGEDPQTLTRKADEAMYAVKVQGGGIRLHGAEAAAEDENPAQPSASLA
jgi:diguanylate cyclase (GGDEF)-like protein